MRQITFVSHNAGVATIFTGNSRIIPMTLSVAPRSPNVPPMASRQVDAKNAVPFCNPAIMVVSTIRRSLPISCFIHSERWAFMANERLRDFKGLISTMNENTIQLPMNQIAALISNGVNNSVNIFNLNFRCGLFCSF